MKEYTQEEIYENLKAEPDNVKCNWDACFEEVKKYFLKNGNFYVPISYVTENGIKLGYWCHNVRKRGKNGGLREDKIERLRSIGFIFEDMAEQKWLDRYAEAVRYYNECGSLFELAENYSKPNVELVKWINLQRHLIATKKIKPERLALLIKIDIFSKRKDANFDKGAMRFIEYKNTHGNPYVPVGYMCSDGYKLGRWVALMRSRKKEGKLTDENIAVLERFGFAWQVRDGAWGRLYRAAKAYFEEYGDLACSASYVSRSGERLGAWLASQRIKYRKGTLSRERLQLLESIGMEWNPASALWMRNYELVRKYYIEHGHHIKTYYTTSGGYALGEWLARQRAGYYNGRLTRERAELLEHIHLVNLSAVINIRTDNLSVSGGA